MARSAAPLWPSGVTLVVLAGGASRRLGRDKVTAHVGGERVIDRLLRDVPDHVPVVLVGPPVERLHRAVVRTLEDSPGSGPLAGIGAGLDHVGTPLVAVLAADMPFGAPVVAGAARLLGVAGARPPGARAEADPGRPATGADLQAVVPVDPEGRRQPLCAAYRSDALRAALARSAPLAGRPVRTMMTALRVMEWPVPAAVLADVDDREALHAVRARVAEEGMGMQEWVRAVSEALGVDVPCDVDVILDVARDVAHHVERPATPVTTYLMGAAIARGADPQQAADRVRDLALGWSDRPPGAG